MAQVIDSARAKGTQAELLRHSSVETTVQYEDNQLRTIQTAENAQSTLRVICDGKVGLAVTSKPDDESRLLDNAVSTAAYGSEAVFSFPGIGAFPAPDIIDPESDAYPVDRMTEVVLDLAGAVRAEGGDVQAGAGFKKGLSTVSLANSSGFSGEFRRTTYAVFLSANRVEGSNMLYVYDFFLGTHADFDLASLKAKVVADFRIGRENIGLDSGEYPVIVSPRAVMDLLRPILACLDGKAVVRGISPWKGRLGEPMFSESFTLFDDGTADRCVNSGAFDTEGIPMKRKPLIEKGVPMNYLLDLETAAQLEMEPTGNGMRSRSPAPAPGITNLIVPAGDKPLTEMIRGVSKGVLVDSLMGAWAGNPYTGMVSGNIDLGYRIENGQRVGRVKDCMLSMNVFEAFRDRLIGFSSDQIRTQSGVLPYFLFDGVNITAKA